jgi:hypothetical protein
MDAKSPVESPFDFDTDDTSRMEYSFRTITGLAAVPALRPKTFFGVSAWAADCPIMLGHFDDHHVQ